MADYEDYSFLGVPANTCRLCASAARKLRAPLRTYEVVWDAEQPSMILEANYAFDNRDEGKGLIFRRYNDGEDVRTHIVANFSTFIYYKEFHFDTGNRNSTRKQSSRVSAGQGKDDADRKHRQHRSSNPARKVAARRKPRA